MLECTGAHGEPEPAFPRPSAAAGRCSPSLANLPQPKCYISRRLLRLLQPYSSVPRPTGAFCPFSASMGTTGQTTTRASTGASRRPGTSPPHPSAGRRAACAPLYTLKHLSSRPVSASSVRRLSSLSSAVPLWNQQAVMPQAIPGVKTSVRWDVSVEKAPDMAGCECGAKTHLARSVARAQRARSLITPSRPAGDLGRAGRVLTMTLGSFASHCRGCRRRSSCLERQ